MAANPTASERYGAKNFYHLFLPFARGSPTVSGAAFMCGRVRGDARWSARCAHSKRKNKDSENREKAADEIAEAIDRFFLNKELNRYVRYVTEKSGELEQDKTIDISMCGLFLFGGKPASDERVRASVEAIREKLSVKTDVGGFARYEGDEYQRVEGGENDGRVPGNLWFVCSLWIAQADIAAAESIEELKITCEMIEWSCRQEDEAKILAEQINPYTGESLSVSPLGWSHAEALRTINAYLDKVRELEAKLR